MKYENTLLNGIAVTQDTIHLSGKARNRLLKDGIKLPMGSYEVTINHLKNLVKNVQKSVHGLTYYDVYPVDRMNYTSFEKIVHDRVIFALRERIPGSAATVQYLLTFRDIDRSFSSLNLKPLNRVSMMYRSLYFLRIWRSFIKNSKSYNLNDNYITSYTHMCVEINAKNLIRLMKEQRDRQEHEMFLSTLYNSQTCEKIFRMFRAMGTTQFTRINFCLLELIHMIGRVEVQNEIAYLKSDVDGIHIPHKRVGKTTIYRLPSDDEINDTIEKAKFDAIQVAKSLGMNLTEMDEIDDFKFESKLNLDDHSNAGDETDEEELLCESQLSDDGIEMYENSELGSEYIISSRSIGFEESDDDRENKLEQIEVDELDNDISRFITLCDENGEEQTILKSTFVWSLTEPGVKISNDRVKRFRYK